MYTLNTDDDNTDEPDGMITATLQPDATRYTVGDPGKV